MTRVRKLTITLLMGLAAAPLVPAPAGAAPPPDPLAFAGSVPGEGRVVTTPPVEAEAPFEVAGLRYDGPPGADVELRASADGRRWTPWYHAPDAGDEGPDLSSPERGEGRATLPVWTGTARHLQYRVVSPEGPVRNLRFQAVDVKGHRESLLSRVSRSVQGLLGAPPAGAAPDQPAVTTRAQWGADESIRKGTPSEGRVRVAFVHHTATGNDYSPSEAPGVVRGIYAYHVRSNGWSDIGYNFLVDRYGTVYEGRYGGMDRPVIGAHAAGFNSVSTGVSLMGSFSETSPPPAMLDSLKRLLAWRLDVAHVDPAGKTTVTSGGSNMWAEGQRVTLDTISGHRDVGQTSCPGSLAYSQLADIRSAVAATPGPKIYDPDFEPATLPGNEDRGYGTTTLKARGTEAFTWSATITGAGQSVVKRVTATGQSLSVNWNATTEGGAFLPPGTYTATITAQGPSGTPRPATVRLTLADVTPRPVTRLFGVDRWATAGAAARQVATNPTANVVLASGEASHLVDSLVAAPLAAAKSAPLLLTPATVLPDATRAELDRLRPATAWIVGGTAAIGAPVADELLRRGISVNRLAGIDAPATAAAVARALGAPRPKALVVSRHPNHLVDGLAASGPGAGLGRPVLLVDRDSVPTVTSQVMAELGTTEVWAVGGRSAISDTVTTRLRARRIAGVDRWETATIMYGAAVDDGLAPATVVVASGEPGNLVDALAGGSFAAGLLLSGRDGLPAVTRDALVARRSVIERAWVLGGASAVGDNAFAGVRAALNGG